MQGRVRRLARPAAPLAACVLRISGELDVETIGLTGIVKNNKQRQNNRPPGLLSRAGQNKSSVAAENEMAEFREAKDENFLSPNSQLFMAIYPFCVVDPDPPPD